ncbi:MAG: PAS domain S-box protein [Cryomorphaceae bacterium]|nr:MAG: PAS domain S-box protein [Cryomorphaceae bacterium]
MNTEAFKQILDCANEVVHVFDESGKLLYVNKMAEFRTGVSAQSVENHSYFDVETTLEKSEQWASWLKVSRERINETFSGEYRNLKSDETFPVEINICLVTFENSLWYVASARDIQGRVETERALAESKEALEQTSKLARVGGWDLDLVRSRLYWTDMTKEIHEVPPDYVPDFQTAVNFYKEGESRDAIVNGLKGALEEGGPMGVKEVQIVTAKGNDLWVRAVGDIERDENGIPMRIYGSFQDIDDQKRTELKLEESLRLLSDLTSNMPGAVYQFEIEPEGTVKYNFVSSGISRLYPNLELPNQGRLEELLGKIVSPLDFRRVQLAILHSAKSLDSFHVEFRHPNLKMLRWFESSAQPKRNEKGTLIWHGYLQDITDRKRRRAELQEFVDVTAEQNKRLLNFTYIISHNIRSHVANLLGIIAILDDDSADVKNHFLPLMRQSVANLDESIKNLNEVVSIQTRVGLNMAVVSLREWVNKTIMNLRVAIEDSGAMVQNEVAEEFTIYTNPAYIESVLLNIISNSIKYRHPDRTAEISVYASKSDDQVMIEVVDNGLGIDMEKYRDVVFGMYKTFHAHRDSKGLGLYITKTQVEALGGRIQMESEVGKGTRVTVTFKNRHEPSLDHR